MNVSPGFVAQYALAMDVSMPNSKYPRPASRRSLRRGWWIEFRPFPEWKVPALPGTGPCRALDIDERSMRVVGRQNQPELGYSVKYEGVVGDYFRALGIPLLKGRTFLRTDNSTNAAPL
jgi:hypothetical protein